MSTNDAELQLVQKVELRFALADSNDKFQSALSTYIAPLLLKFASDNLKVKVQLSKTVKFLLDKFNSTPALKLPSSLLLDQIKSPNLKSNQDKTLVQSYTLLFLSKSIQRLSVEEKLDLFPKLLQNISDFKLIISARLFNIACKLLVSIPLDNLNKFDLNDSDETFLIDKFYKFMLLQPIHALENGQIPKTISQPGLSSTDCSFFAYDAGVTFDSSTLSTYKLKLLKFVEFLQLEQKSVVIYACASTDPDSAISTLATSLLKRVSVDYEDKYLIDTLISLYTGHSNKAPPIKAQLQEKFLSILCKSKIAANSPEINEICSIGLNSSNNRLKQATVSFIRWFSTILASNDSPIQKDLNNNIATQLKLNLSNTEKNPSNFSSYITQRRYQYETLGFILKKIPKLIDFSYIEFLFDMLNFEDIELKTTVQDVLSGFATHLSLLDEPDKEKLKKLLTNIIESSNDSIDSKNTGGCRFIAIKFANSTFPFDDAQARLLNIMAQTLNDKAETVEQAKKGLHPYWFRLNNALAASEVVKFPSFNSVIQALSNNKSQINLEIGITFALRCLVMNSIKGKKTIISMDQDWEVRIDKALDFDPTVRNCLVKMLKDMTDSDGDIVLINDNQNSLDDFIKISFDYIFETSNLTVMKDLNKILSLSQPATIGKLTGYIPNLLSGSSKVISYESSHYCSKILGILCCHPNFSDHEIVETIATLLKASSILPIGYIVSRLILSKRSLIITDDIYTRVLKLLQSNLNSPSSKAIKDSLDCLSQFSMFGCLGPELKLSSSLSDFKVLFIEKLKPMVKRFDESATMAWCYLALSYPSSSNSPDSLTDFEQTLFDTYTTKQTDTLFTSGEGFSILASGWSSSVLKDKIDIQDVEVINHNTNRCPIVLNSILEACKNTKPSLRKAGCIWLLSLVQYCNEPVIVKRLNEIQYAFMRFLSDREDIIQESASRGLSIVYEKGDGELKDVLVHDLLTSLTDTKKTTKQLMSGYVNEDTQLFEPGVLNTGDGETVSTYKDVLSLASEVGDPSLVYKFMSLAKNSALWSSRKGIAFGIGAILDKSKLDSLLSDNPKLSNRLIPKLFRYKHDPNTSVARTMNDIWNTLITDTNKTVIAHFDVILKELLSDMGNREWRVRQASTAGLQELLRQVEFSKYENKLEEIWVMSFRAMDDIKESVRKEGGSLTMYLANTMVMKIGNSSGNSKAQESILKQLVPFLLGNNGLLSDAEDIKNFAFETILKLANTCSKSLKPFAGEMIQQMILLMSSVEPQVVNYLALNAEKYKLKPEDIDTQRLGAVGSSPMMEAIEKLMNLLDDETMNDFIESLSSTVKKSVGLPSKVACSKVIVDLIVRYFFTSNRYGDQLLKIAAGQLKDRNETVAKSYAMTCGYCVRIASIKKVQSFSNKLVKYYFEKKNDNDDRLSKISSVACESVSKFSNDKFQSIAVSFLPLSFIGKHDLDKNIADNFNKVWSDSTSSGSNSIKLYFPEIVELMKSHIESQNLSIRQTIALSIIEIVDKLGSQVSMLNPNHLLELYSILLESLKGRSYEGKENLLNSLVLLSTNSQKFLTSNDDLFGKVLERVITEAKRQNSNYKKHSIKSLGFFLSEYPEDESVYNIYIELIDGLINPVALDSDTEDEDRGMSDKKKRENSIMFKQSLLLNLISSMNKEQSNQRLINYSINQIQNFLTNTQVNLLETSDEKYKFKLGILGIISKIIEKLNDDDRLIHQDQLFKLWEQAKTIGSNGDNLQAVLVSFVRLTRLLFNSLKLSDDQFNKCFNCLKLLQSENINSVITVEVEKTLNDHKK